MPPEVATDFECQFNELSEIHTIQLPRPIVKNQLIELQLHMFCDASEKAYATVIYSRAKDKLGFVTVHLLTSKTKVAPVKVVSLPRLELCDAHLGAQLLKLTKSHFDVFNAQMTLHAWTDSTIVLQWLAQIPRTWNTFVANRVAQIQEVLKRDCWNHCSTNDNPADLASRGDSVKTLINSTQWWQGPIWLSLESDCWPKIHLPNKAETLEKRKASQKVTSKIDQLVSHASRVTFPETDDILPITRFSNLDKLIRITSYVLKFIFKCKQKVSKDTSVLIDVTIREHALIKLVRQEQHSHLYEEIAALKNNDLNKESPLENLSPFYDPEHDLVRVGGRQSQSAYVEDKKFPYLLPTESPLTNLIIDHFHETTLHGGGQLTLNTIRQQFWIINGRKTVNKRLRNCVKCYRFQSQPIEQMMADLPSERVTPAQPFSQTGLDFAGPIKIKDAKIQKIYIAVFVCLATKAIHLEMVSSLNKQDCIMALKRFVARRGKPKKIISDNGSNFNGARNDLMKIQAILGKSNQSESLRMYLSQQGIEWVTIPPRAPHFGGVWEAGVKSMKRHLRRVVGVQRLNYEELLTFINQIEAILNSRPLFPMSNDPNDFSPLTPGHFLIGDSMISLPQEDKFINSNQPFKLLQKMYQDFWKSWKRDYLTELQVRKNGSLTVHSLL